MQLMSNSLATTCSNIKSNRQVFLISIATITIAFSILGLFLIIFVNLNSFLTTWNQQVQLIVYLEDNVTPEQRRSLEQSIAKNPDVEAMTFIPKEEAWAKLKNTFSSKKSNFIDDLNFNPLPSSYNLKFKPSEDRFVKIRQSAENFKKINGVESLEYGEKWLAAFEKFMVFIRLFIFAIGTLLALGLILIISNTIKLSFYSRQDEIELMLLIGATPNFVRIPFLIEGVLQGLFGGIIGLTVIKTFHIYIGIQFQGSLESLARGIDFHFIPAPLIFGLLLSGSFIGWMGSFLSIQQFLNLGQKK